MQQDVKYMVSSSLGEVVGYFLNGSYYEGGWRAGHVDEKDQFVYYVVRPGEAPRVIGRIEGNILVREDGYQLIIAEEK